MLLFLEISLEINEYRNLNVEIKLELILLKSLVKKQYSVR